MVVVRRVIDGPARSAGIRHGDVITNIDGETIRNVSSFRNCSRFTCGYSDTGASRSQRHARVSSD